MFFCKIVFIFVIGFILVGCNFVLKYVCFDLLVFVQMLLGFVYVVIDVVGVIVFVDIGFEMFFIDECLCQVICIVLVNNCDVWIVVVNVEQVWV